MAHYIYGSRVHLSHNAQNGLLLGTQLGNVTTQRSYNNFGELQEETANYQSSPLFHRYYVRDKVGRITQKLETYAGLTISTEYAYDVAGRLIEVKQNGSVVETYQYDANGNRLNNNALYDAQDRLLQYASNTYTYTQNGELLTKNTTTFNYDVLGNLRQVQLPSKTIDYVIDARNRRVGKKVNGQLVQGFLYQGSLKPVAELNGTGQIVARFVYGSKANIPDYIVKNGNTYRVISDHPGSPRLVVDIQTGAVVQRMEFDAFGNVTLDTNPGFQPFGFAGGLYDLDTKLVRFGARDYDAEIGRWTSKDPIKFAGGDTNLFGYVANDPVNWVDPSGLGPWDQTYGWSKKFWNWFHKLDNGKTMKELKNEKGQVEKDDALPYYEEWLKKQGNDDQQGYIDPEILIDLMMPWWLAPSEMGADPCELLGGNSCEVKHCE